MSVRYLADADLDLAIVRGVHHREPAIDFKSATEAGLGGLSDPAVLELAAAEKRILVSHDTSTMPVHFAARSSLGIENPGVLLVSQRTAVGEVVESLVMIWSASRQEEWANLIHYVPSMSRHVFR